MAIRPGQYIYVNRSALARSALAMAIERGVAVVDCHLIAPMTMDARSVWAIVFGVAQILTFITNDYLISEGYLQTINFHVF